MIETILSRAVSAQKPHCEWGFCVTSPTAIIPEPASRRTSGLSHIFQMNTPKVQNGKTSITAKNGKSYKRTTAVSEKKRAAGSLKKFSHFQNTDISRILENDDETADLFEMPHE